MERVKNDRSFTRLAATQQFERPFDVRFHEMMVETAETLPVDLQGQSDAARCCLNGWCCWMLRKERHTVAQATAALEGKNVSEKNELLFARGINFNDLRSGKKLLARFDRVDARITVGLTVPVWLRVHDSVTNGPAS
jgi:tRNA(His) 5'-end guanylyltransferase